MKPQKILVLYKSFYGHTKQYAEWISEALHADLSPIRRMDASRLAAYDVILYGGGLYASGISGVSSLLRHFDRLRGKRLILFTCGLADPADERNVDAIWRGIEKNFSEEQRQAIRFFHLRGGIDYPHLGPVHRAMMAMLRKMLLKKEPEALREEDRQLLATYGGTVDFMDRASIEPILAFVKEGQNG